MKNCFRFLLAACVLACLSAFAMHAQTEEHSFYHDSGFTMGVNVPLYKDSNGRVTMGFTCGNFYDNGLGFRTGIQYNPDIAGVTNSFGIPVAFAYRTRPRSRAEKVSSAVSSVESSIDDACGRNYNYNTTSGKGSFMAGVFSFLLSLVNDAEFTAGITPGYIAGGSSSVTVGEYSNGYTTKEWTECPTPFSLSLDAGICLNYNIWRFDLKVMPAFHYNLTDNYVKYKSIYNPAATGTLDSSQTLKWFFTFSGGLTFNF